MKTPGQVMRDALRTNGCWQPLPSLNACELAAHAVLAAQWVPLSEKPEKEEFVLCGGGDKLRYVARLGHSVPGVTHWLRIPPLPTPPEPTPEEKERAEFEAHPEFNRWERNRTTQGTYVANMTEGAWRGWFAARAAKEEAK